ncbi:MAG: hypothetical protein ABSE39_04740 [Candidatus Bathyarchaeia archaeon]|jgi:hypothetical protein
MPPSVTQKDRINQFIQIPEVSTWFKAADLKLGTRENYALRLMQLFGEMNISPPQFLQECNSNRKQVLSRIKIALGGVREHSASVAHQQRAALVNFVSFYQDQFDQPLTINYKVKVRRVRMKKGLTFEQADKIIAECTHPYREIFRFLLWSGMDQSTFAYINSNPKLVAEIQAQLSDSTRDYVRIDLPPRKANMDVYFVCIPKLAFDNLALPVSTRTHKLRNGDLKGGQLIKPEKLKKRWVYAAKKAKLWYVGMGAHHLRSAFHTQGVRANVDDRMLLFHLGKGGDKFGYVRPEEQDVVRELRKVWQYNSPQAALEEQNKQLVERIRKLEASGNAGQELEKLREELQEVRFEVRMLEDASKLKVITPEVKT